MGISSDQGLKDVVPDFQRFLRERRLASERHAPLYAVRVSQFLAFANKYKDKDGEALMQRFLDHLETRGDVSAGLVRQAGEALQLYLFQYEEGIHFRELHFGQVDAPAFSSVGDVLAEMKRHIRLKHYSYNTEETYRDWAKRFFAYVTETRKTDVNACNGDDVKGFLSHLALRKKVSSSTQNQAFNALLFLFREVLRQDLNNLSGTVRAKRGVKLPVVLSVEEVKRLFSHLSGRGHPSYGGRGRLASYGVREAPGEGHRLRWQYHLCSRRQGGQ